MQARAEFAEARAALATARVRLVVATLVLALFAALASPARPVRARRPVAATTVNATPIAARRAIPERPPGAPVAALAGSTDRGRRGAEQSALALVARTGGLPVGGARWRDWLADPGAQAIDRCPAARLEVRWAPPEGDYRLGGYVEPLGPPPGPQTRQVNGVVVCRGSTYAYEGFQASWDGARWLLDAVPMVSAETDHPVSPADAAPPEPAAAPAVPLDEGALPDPSLWQATPLEPPAAYVPQQLCDPFPKPGVLGFRDLLLSAEPGSRNLGISRACDTPDGVSEHKEGRAFDWGVNADDPAEAAMAGQVLSWLLAPDAGGNPFAMARRLGIMYVIWDRHIWGAYLADQGWRPYHGVSEHRDHVHFSFSWDGALGRTSFWQGALSDRLQKALAEVPGARFAVPSPPFAGLIASALGGGAAPGAAPARVAAEPVAAPADPGAAPEGANPSDERPGSVPPADAPPATTTTTTTPPTTTPPTTTTTTSPQSAPPFSLPILPIPIFGR